MTTTPERITLTTLDAYLNRYETAREGSLNEDTYSEAMFVLIGRHLGAYVLSTCYGGPLWVGVQNATARWTDDGKPFTSIRSALERALTSSQVEVFFSEEAVGRLQWLASQIETLRATGNLNLS